MCVVSKRARGAVSSSAGRASAALGTEKVDVLSDVRFVRCQVALV